MIDGLGKFVGFALAALLLYGMQKTTPGYGEITGPIAVSGRVGEKLAARDFELTVTNVVFSKQIKVEAFGREEAYTTAGRWAVVEALAAARRETISVFAAAWLGRNGARYAMTERLSNAPGLLPAEVLEPGLPRKVLLVFEFPQDQGAGATMLVARNAYTPLDDELRVTIDAPQDEVHEAVRIERTDPGWKMEVE